MAGAGDDVLPAAIQAIDCLIRVVHGIDGWNQGFQTTTDVGRAPAVKQVVLVHIFRREANGSHRLRHAVRSSGSRGGVDDILEAILASGDVSGIRIGKHTATIREEHQVAVLSAEVHQSHGFAINHGFKLPTSSSTAFMIPFT